MTTEQQETISNLEKWAEVSFNEGIGLVAVAAKDKSNRLPTFHSLIKPNGELVHSFYATK